ncbi:flagellar motor protein MotB [Pseudoalteromonas sp. SIMBA_153]
MMENKNQEIVIKRSRRKATEKPHGGAWKVAFADFTLAMMAFFMVMWIMAITNESEREEIAHYMRTHSIFDGGPAIFDPQNSPFPVDLGGSPSVIKHLESGITPPDSPRPGMSEVLQVPDGTVEPKAGQGEKLNSAIDSQFEASSELSLLLESIDELSKEELLKNNLLVEEVPLGLRVIIRDDKHHQMFERSKSQMTPFFEDLFLYLGGLVKDINNKIIISGHSDASLFVDGSSRNWDISGDRAQQARKVMTMGGMPSSQVLQVNAFSSNRPINKEDKKASENRRVELLILTKDAQDKFNQLFDDSNINNPVKKAAGAATANKPVLRLEENYE